jgi:hypothetical protein
VHHRGLAFPLYLAHEPYLAAIPIFEDEDSRTAGHPGLLVDRTDSTELNSGVWLLSKDPLQKLPEDWIRHGGREAATSTDAVSCRVLR